jgi:hypothetical protein
MPTQFTQRQGGGEITGKQVFQWTKSLLKKGFTPSEETQLAKQAVEAAQKTFDQAASQDAQFATILEKVDNAARAIALERLNPEYRAKVEKLFNQAEALFTEGRNVGAYEAELAEATTKVQEAKASLKAAKAKVTELNSTKAKPKSGEQTLANSKMDLNSFKNNPVYKNESEKVSEKIKIVLEKPTPEEIAFFGKPARENTNIRSEEVTKKAQQLNKMTKKEIDKDFFKDLQKVNNLGQTINTPSPEKGEYFIKY